VLGLCCFTGFSLDVVSGAYSLVAVHALLIAVASSVVEHRLQGAQASVAAALWDVPRTCVSCTGS